jgi:hypothetical protein
MPSDQPHAIPAGARSLELLKWLVEMTNPAGGQMPLLIVLQKLRESMSDAYVRNCLDRHIDQLRRYFGIGGSPIALTSASVSLSERPGLMLDIRRSASAGNRCNVQGWLFYAPERTESVCVREGDNALNLDDPADLENLVTELKDIISEREVDEAKVTVELFLPTELQCQTVEQWKDEFGDPLGIRFPVVVRSRERLHNSKRHLGWRKNWDTLHKHWERPLPSCLWPYEESLRRQVLCKLKEGVCIVLSFVPDLRAPIPQNAMLYLIYNGTSVALWPRRNDCLEGLTQQLCEHFADKPLSALPEAIRAMRQALWVAERENTPCYHLALLWDDPNRLPPAKPNKDDEFLQAPA